jgi:ribosomal protein S12 methylthiotransferase accessory factor
MPNGRLEAARSRLVDCRYGLVPEVHRDEQAPHALTLAHFATSGADLGNVSYGAATNYRESELVALLEALERHDGMSARGKRTKVHGSFRELQYDAVDPEHLGLHDPQFTEHTATKLLRYSPDLVINWVWGHSFMEARPKLIPEQTAYYRREDLDWTITSDRFCLETSNGCALGASIEEALLHALLEVIERDSFLMTWYARLGARELFLGGVESLAARTLIAKIEDEGYSVHCFDTTSEFAVPAVWVVAVGVGGSHAASMSAGGASHDPERALLSALSDLATNVVWYERRAPRPADRRQEAKRLRNMLASSEEVRTAEDHVALYTLPEASERLSFLFDPSRAGVPFEEAFVGWQERWSCPDLTECLNELLSHILSLGLDVLAVDQTSPEQRELGFRTVKAVVPGTLPMTFGHLYHRTRGIRRLLTVPVRLGYWSRPKRYQDLEILPHPFP